MRLTPIAARPIAPPSPAALPEPSVPPSPAAGQGAQTDLTQLPLPLSIASQMPARARKPERLPGQQGQQEQAAAKSDHDVPYDWHDSPSCDDGDDDWRRDGASSRRVRRHDGSGCETLTSPRLLPGNGKPSNNASGPIGPTPGSGSPEGGTPGGGSTGGSSAGSGSPAGLPSGGPGNAPGSQGGSPGPTGRVFDFDPDGRWRPDLPAPGPVNTPLVQLAPPLWIGPGAVGGGFPLAPPPDTYGPPGYDPRLERPRGTPGYGEDSLPPLPSLLPQIHIPAAPAPLINPSAPPPDRDDQMRDKTPSEILGGNLEAAGVPRPPDTAAHHIVPYGDRRAQRIRDLLGSFNPPIDLNSAANGVFLPSRPGSTAPGAYHPSLHSDDYYNAINRDLGRINNRDRAIDILNRIRESLLDGTYPGSKPVPPKE